MGWYAPCTPTWEGSYNATHADKKPGGVPRSRAGCLTYIPDLMGGSGTQFRRITNYDSTCTSCRKGYVFMMRMHKSRAGKCEYPNEHVAIENGALDKNALSGPEDKNFITTKVV